MLPLLLPWIVIALPIATFILLFCKKWRVAVLLIVLSIVVNWWSECIPFRLWPLCEKSGYRSIKVLTFNISSTKVDISKKAEKLANLIGKKSPDIIYVSELSETNKPLLDLMLVNIYPYTIYTYSHGFYSKYPLPERITLEDDNIKKGRVVKCLVVKGTDTLVFYGCHLASNNYSADSKYITPDSIKSHSTLVQYFKNISQAYTKRIRAASVITRDVSKIEKPVIVLGDMNDVCGSKTIRQMESLGLKDAWWEGGFGYGATIHRPLPYRIDHILYSNHLKLNCVKVVSSLELSDHDAVFAEFSY